MLFERCVNFEWLEDEAGSHEQVSEQYISSARDSSAHRPNRLRIRVAYRSLEAELSGDKFLDAATPAIAAWGRKVALTELAELRCSCRHLH